VGQLRQDQVVRERQLQITKCVSYVEQSSTKECNCQPPPPKKSGND
jgi:hypothetical protein